MITMARILETNSLKHDNLLEISTESAKINDLRVAMELGVFGEEDTKPQVRVLLGLQVSCAFSWVTF